MIISQRVFRSAVLVALAATNSVAAFGDPLIFIEEGVACTAATACQNNEVGTYLNISGTSCTEEQACSDNTLDSFAISDGACSGSKSPDKSYGTCSSNTGGSVSLGDSSGICSGASSCSNNTASLTFDGDDNTNICIGSHSCSDNALTMGALGGNVCTGDDSCSFLALSGSDNSIQKLVLGRQVCQGARSCSHSQGTAIIDNGACNGDNSCHQWKVGGDIGAYFNAGTNSCTGANSCQTIVVGDTWEYINIMEGSCTGTSSCQNLTVEDGQTLEIRAGACTQDNSCQNCRGQTIFETGSQKCSDPEGSTSGAGYIMGFGMFSANVVIATTVVSMMVPC